MKASLNDVLDKVCLTASHTLLLRDGEVFLHVSYGEKPTASFSWTLTSNDVTKNLPTNALHDRMLKLRLPPPIVSSRIPSTPRWRCNPQSTHYPLNRTRRWQDARSSNRIMHPCKLACGLSRGNYKARRTLKSSLFAKANRPPGGIDGDHHQNPLSVSLRWRSNWRTWMPPQTSELQNCRRQLSS